MCTRTCRWLLSSLAVLCLLPGTSLSSEDSEPDAVSLSAQWWQLVLSIPNAESPFFDDTGARCITGQRGDVWFLYGNPSTVSGEPTVSFCTVPAGVMLFFPVITAMCVPLPDETLEQVRRDCREAIDAVDFTSLEIDDQDQSELIKRKRQSKPFPVSLPEENFFDLPEFDAPAGTYLGVADGLFAKVHLPKGEHTIHLQSSISSEGIAFDLIFVINIVAPERSITPRPNSQ